MIRLRFLLVGLGVLLTASLSLGQGTLGAAYARAVRAFSTDTSGGQTQYRAEQPWQGLTSTFSGSGGLKLAVEGEEINVGVRAFWSSEHGVIGATRSHMAKDANGWPQVNFDRPNLSEWYVNEANGLHHWMKVDQRPGDGSSSLWIQVGVSGAERVTSLSDNAVEVRTKNHVFTYSGVKAWDVRGRVLPARLVVSGTSIHVSIDDHGAKYPVTIDPTWALQQKITISNGASLDTFGKSMAISGDTAVIISGGVLSAHSAAYFFTRTNGSWALDMQVRPSDPQTNKTQLLSCALDGDYAVFGAVAKGSNEGAAYVFVHAGSVWSQLQTLIVEHPGGKFGASVAIKGNTILVGTDSQSAAYVFTTSQGVYYQTAELVGNDGGVFGSSVAIHKENAVFVNGTGGSVYYYANNGQGWVQQQKLAPVDLTANSNFGSAIAVDGDRVLIGASNDAGKGSAYFYEFSQGSWTPTKKIFAFDRADGDGFGQSVALLGFYAVVGAYHANATKGAAYVFERDNSLWTQLQELVAFDGSAGDGFGGAVGVTAGSVLVSSPTATGSKGAAYVFAQNLGGIALRFSGPAGVSGGSTVLTVTLSAPSPAGGTTVTLRSSSPKLSGPGTVVIPAGQTVGTATCQLGTVTTDTQVSIEATAPSWSGGAASLTITGPPQPLLRFTVADAAIATGGSTTATATIKNPAGSNGEVVYLTSDSGQITVPQSVKIAAGTTSISFTVQSTGTTKLTTKVNATVDGRTVLHAAIKVVDPLLKKIEFSPRTIVSGGATYLVIGLDSPAPAGGTVVTLTSSNTSLLVLPESVTVPARQTVVRLSVQAAAWTGAVDQVTASARVKAGLAQSAVLTITAPTVSALTAEGVAIGVRGSMIGTATLTGLAGPQGVVVTLRSDQPSVTVPTSVAIPAGQKSATFTIASTGSLALKAKLTGTLGSVSKNLSISVVNPTLGSVKVSPGTVRPGSIASVTVTISTVAPVGGVTILLMSSNPDLAPVPSSIVIAAGQHTGAARFTVGQTQSVTSITITGKITGANSQIATFQIRP